MAVGDHPFASSFCCRILIHGSFLPACADHIQVEVLLCSCVFAVGWLEPRGKMEEAAVAEPVVLVWFWEERC